MKKILKEIKTKANDLTTKNLKYVYIAILAIFFFSFGFLFSQNLSSKNTSIYNAVAADDPIAIPTLLQEVKEKIDNKFISWKATSTQPTKQDLMYGMIKGYVSAYGDPYTTYFTPKEAKLFNQTIQGSFDGIGAQIEVKNNKLIVVAPIKGSPAEKIGIKTGDVIISVNGTSTEGLSVDQAVSMIRGDVGTKVKLKLIHANDTKVTEYEITRDVIKVPEMESEVIGDVFVIHFYSFTANSAVDFENYLQDFIKSGKTKLIIDLRGNGGGYLDSAINIASFFLPDNKVVVTEKGNKQDGDKIDYSRGFNYFNSNLRLVVLIDGGSASASEILAGALKDNGIATIVGEKSFGKGSVQQLETLSDGSAIKVTVAKWYTPSGINISESGIMPDVWASSTNATTSIKSGTTTKVINMQLKAAIDVLYKMK